MEYKISFNILDKQLVDVNLDGYTKIADVISFLVENFQELVGNDSSRIIITQKKLNRQLSPLLTIAQILQGQLIDTFDVEINSQSFIDNAQNKFTSSQPQSNQGQNKQMIQDGIIKMNLQYNNQKFDCELQLDTSLEELSYFAVEHFKIQGKVQMQYENQNLSYLPGSTKLHNILIKNGSTIQFFQQQQQQIVQQTYQALPTQKQQQSNQGKIVKIQFQIQDGIIMRSCVQNCGSNQQLKELKQPVLSFIGINGVDIADVDFYVGNQAMVDKTKLEKTLAQLSLDKDYVTLIARIRWIGG